MSRPSVRARGWLARLSGLGQGRHECLVVQLEREPAKDGQNDNPSADHQRRLVAAWKDVRGVLAGP
ncbi:MAG: hypothetical protein ACK41W_02990 [Cyanobacteriota bacterium]